MKYLYIVLLLLPGFAWAESVFPDNPVPIRPGYGSEGAGTHMAVPSGTPFGPDCVVNPVSFSTYLKTITTTRTEKQIKVKENMVIIVPSSSLFDFDESYLLEDAGDALDTFISVLVANDVEEITVTGHTDSHGTRLYNQSLGLSRAASVVGYLRGSAYQGLMHIRSGGELIPIAPNEIDGVDYPEGRQMNRRVEIVVNKLKPITYEEKTDVVEESIERRPRNPQIFHVLSSGANINCGGYPAIRTININ